MPPKTKIGKEAVLNVAYEITREKGVASLTAKLIAARLKCSTQPIYWAYGTMEALRNTVTEKAAQEYLLRQAESIKNEENHDDRERYKATGLNYIRFAKQEPELFKLLFMSDRDGETSLFSSELDGNKSQLVGLIRSATGLDPQKANEFYVSNWIVVHGIATMLITSTAILTDEQIEKILFYTYRGVLAQLKAE